MICFTEDGWGYIDYLQYVGNAKAFIEFIDNLNNETLDWPITTKRFLELKAEFINDFNRSNRAWTMWPDPSGSGLEPGFRILDDKLRYLKIRQLYPDEPQRVQPEANPTNWRDSQAAQERRKELFLQRPGIDRGNEKGFPYFKCALFMVGAVTAVTYWGFKSVALA